MSTTVPAAGFETIPVLPLRDIVVFPHMIVPLFVGREKSIKALEMAEEKEAIAQYGSADAGASLGDILGAALKKANKKDDSDK